MCLALANFVYSSQVKDLIPFLRSFEAIAGVLELSGDGVESLWFSLPDVAKRHRSNLLEELCDYLCYLYVCCRSACGRGQ